MSIFLFGPRAYCPNVSDSFPIGLISSDVANPSLFGHAIGAHALFRPDFGSRKSLFFFCATATIATGHALEPGYSRVIRALFPPPKNGDFLKSAITEIREMPLVS